jgi:type IV pilus assembly protein PilA
MLSNLKTRAGDEKGFTLIELLVVILIIAILAAVAIPTFLNQRGKAYDSNAQSMVKNMQTAEETFATNNNGTYTGTLSDLTGVDPSIRAGNGVTPTVTGGTGSTTGYTVVATATSTGDAFTITESNGTETNTCSVGTGGGNPGACPSSHTWQATVS